jgi:phage recombination protein Bet
MNVVMETTNVAKETTPARLPMPNSTALAGINQQQWKVLCETIFPAAKSAEAIEMAVSYCAARKLDVFKRPVHIVPVWDSNRRQQVETVWPGLHEIRSTAHRTNSYAGSDPVSFGKEVTKSLGGKDVTFPESATFTVYRLTQGQRCGYTQTVFFEEVVSTTKNGAPTQMWLTRTKGQLAKCAEVAALRMAFPEELGNDYIPEEMEGKPYEVAQPRTVIEVEGEVQETKSNSKLDTAFGIKEEADKVLEDPNLQKLQKLFPDATLEGVKPTAEGLFSYMRRAKDALQDPNISIDVLNAWETVLDFDYAPGAVRDLIDWLTMGREFAYQTPTEDIPF